MWTNFSICFLVSFVYLLLASLVPQMVEPAHNVRDLGSNPGLGTSSVEGNGNPFQYSCLENLIHRGAWWATVHGVARAGHDLVTTPPPPVLNDIPNSVCRSKNHSEKH